MVALVVQHRPQLRRGHAFEKSAADGNARGERAISEGESLGSIEQSDAPVKASLGGCLSELAAEW